MSDLIPVHDQGRGGSSNLNPLPPAPPRQQFTPLPVQFGPGPRMEAPWPDNSGNATPIPEAARPDGPGMETWPMYSPTMAGLEPVAAWWDPTCSCEGDTK